MAEAEDQQNFVAHNGDQVPDQGLDEVHNGLQYQVHDETLGHQPYEVQDPTLEPQQYGVQDPTAEYGVQDPTLESQQYGVQDQLEYQEYQVQDQGNEEVQDQLQDGLQYQPQNQEQYQLQDQAHDQGQYQVKGESQGDNGDEVQDQVADEEGIPEHDESTLTLKSESEGGATVGGEEKRWPGWPGETVFRMLVPAQKVGSIIGRKGDVIKKIVEETRARIKILDGPPGTTERAVSSCKFYGNICKASDMKNQSQTARIQP